MWRVKSNDFESGCGVAGRSDSYMLMCYRSVLLCYTSAVQYEDVMVAVVSLCGVILINHKPSRSSLNLYLSGSWLDSVS